MLVFLVCVGVTAAGLHDVAVSRERALRGAERLGAPMASAFRSAQTADADPASDAVRAPGLEIRLVAGVPSPAPDGWREQEVALPFARAVVAVQGFPRRLSPFPDGDPETVFAALACDLAANGRAARLWVEARPGIWIGFASPLYWRDRITPVELLLIGLAAAGVLIWMAFWSAGRLARQVEEMAERIVLPVDAAEPSLLPDDGAVEIAAIAGAINTAREATRVQMEARTRLLVAVSHDLRTPATRLRLRAEYVEDEGLRAKILGDIGELSSMIASALEFFNNDVIREATETVSFSSLIQSLCDDYADLGQPVVLLDTPPLGFTPVRTVFGGHGARDSLKFDRQLRLSGRPASLRRAFTNLIDNAIFHGKRAVVSIDADADEVTVEVADDGPGIPEVEMENVFKPFFRLDRSRSRQTGGVGLGLSIVKSVVDAHQGRIAMFNRPGGGLSVRVTLPRRL